PTVRLEGAAARSVQVGEPLALSAEANDDDLPPIGPAPPSSPGFRSATGLRVAWFVYRGPGDTVRFDPEQFKVYPDFLGNSPFARGGRPPPLPANRKFPVTVTFSMPGTYVVRVMAHDGGFAATADVTVTVHTR